jgi:peptidoglycan lytic transglycosylase
LLFPVSLRPQSGPSSQSHYKRSSLAQPFEEVGVASWYGDDCSMNSTASGKPYDPDGLTAAHRTLPLGAWIRVTNLHNLRSVILLVNDRGPFVAGRILDVSERAARLLGFKGAGVTTVRIDLVAGPGAGPSGSVTSLKPAKGQESESVKSATPASRHAGARISLSALAPVR